MICGEIIRQRLKLIGEHVVADTIDYLEAKFRFTDDWNGLEKWAHFSQKGVVYDIPLTDDRIRKEDHLNLSAGIWSVYLHGNEFLDGEVIERITTNAETLRVIPTGTLDGEPFPEIPASVAEQILARLDNVEKNGPGGLAPVDKTEAMTAEVGRDEAGRLWTAGTGLGVQTFGWGQVRNPMTGAVYDAIALFREDGKMFEVSVSSVFDKLSRDNVVQALGYTPPEEGLPEHTDADEGKFLRIVGNAAVWGENPADAITEELPPSSNLLSPESLPKRINLTDGVTIEGSATLERHTPERIPFPYARAYVMLSPSYEGDFGSIVAVMYYDENDAYLGYSTIKPTSVSTNFSTAVKTGTAYIRVWTNNYLDFSYVSVSGEKITEWEAYFPGGYAVREDALPWDAVREHTRPLYGKVIANFGDSIFGNKRPPNDISTALSDITGATVYNLGFGGCRMGAHSRSEYDAFSMYRLAEAIAGGDFSVQDAVNVSSVSDMPSYFTQTRDLLKSIDWNDVDIVTIAYGTNDFTGGNTLDDAEDFGDYAYSLRYSIETLLTAYPHLKIFVCGQTYRFWFDDAGAFAYDSDTYTYKEHKLTDFVAKTAEVCAEYHLPFVDNYDGLGINKFNRGQYFPADDGTHHNAAGARLIAEHMARELF